MYNKTFTFSESLLYTYVRMQINAYPMARAGAISAMCFKANKKKFGDRRGKETRS